MPPRKKADVPAEDAAEELCPEHYPLGWETVPAEHSGVGCEHGSWTRPASDEEGDG